MPGPVRLYRRFIASTRGVVAIEFAAILPVLLIMLLATFDGGSAIAVYMKVRAATYVLASVTNQYSTAMPIQSTNMTGIMSATTAVLAPYSSTPLAAVISELKITATKATTAKVCWSATQNGTALAAGSTVNLPTGISSSTNTCNTYSVLPDPCPSELHLYAAFRLFWQRRDHAFRYRVCHAAQQHLHPVCPTTGASPSC